MTKEYSSIPDTLKHIRRVQYLIKGVIDRLIIRAIYHDESKLSSPEMEIFDEYTPKLKDTTYGSDEYKLFMEEMTVALEHHYFFNRHHPEHFKGGVNDMTLVDLIEMLCDWKAATERHKDGDIHKSIEINSERFGITSQLKQILTNTIKELRLAGYL